MLSLEGVILVEELDAASATSSPSGHGTESSTDMPWPTLRLEIGFYERDER